MGMIVFSEYLGDEDIEQIKESNSFTFIKATIVSDIDVDNFSDNEFENTLAVALQLKANASAITFIEVEENEIDCSELEPLNNYLGTISAEYVTETESFNLLNKEVIKYLHVKEITSSLDKRLGYGNKDLIKILNTINDEEFSDEYEDFFYKIDNWQMISEEIESNFSYLIKDADILN